MKAILFLVTAALTHLASADVHYYNQVELSTTSTQIRLVDAQYAVIPTKTVVQPIPGCNPSSEGSPDCNETIVLESQGVIQAYISYQDSLFPSDSNQLSYTYVTMPLTTFSSSDVALLQSVYPAWKHPFTSIPRKFAASKLALNVVKAKKGVQIVDVKNSVICPTNESGEPAPGCVEHLVYKTVQSPILVGTVTLK